MKPFIRMISVFGLAVLVGLGAAGCDLGGNGEQQPMPPPKPTQPGQPATPPTYPPPGESGGGPSQLPINDMDLERAASAYVVITEDERKVQESMEQAEDNAAKQDLQAAVNQRMMQAIKNAGLTVDMYNNIMQLVRTNEDLGERFQEKVQRLQ